MSLASGGVAMLESWVRLIAGALALVVAGGSLVVLSVGLWVSLRVAGGPDGPSATAMLAGTLLALVGVAVYTQRAERRKGRWLLASGLALAALGAATFPW